MAGFLDRQERIVDLVLTQEGRRLLSRGTLEFVYFSLFDDEVDYDPYVANSGSLSSAQVTASMVEQTEAAVVVEAVSGRTSDVSLWTQPVCLTRRLFTMPQGQTTLPRLSIDPDVVSGSIVVKQRALLDVHVNIDQFGRTIDQIGPFNRGFERFDPTTFVLDVGVDDYFDESRQDGCRIVFFSSGSDGLSELDPRIDVDGFVSYGTDVKMIVDAELRGR